MKKGHQMSAQELREHMHGIGITHAALAMWLGIHPRTAQRYTDESSGTSQRKVDPALAVLMRLMRRRPDVVDDVRSIALGEEVGAWSPIQEGTKEVTRLYLDTEFNSFGGELISMALVCQDGRQWYAATELCDRSRGGWERYYNEWVVANVLPKLETEELSLADFRAFIAQFDAPEVICDSPADALHFCSMLQGDGRNPGMDLAFSVSVVRTPEGEPVSDNPHNALSDAIALMRWHQAAQAEGETMFARKGGSK